MYLNEARNEQEKADLALIIEETLKQRIKGVKNEWSKVSWPTKKQVIVETVIVLIVVTFFTLVVYFMDIIFKALLGLIK